MHNRKSWAAQQGGRENRNHARMGASVCAELEVGVPRGSWVGLVTVEVTCRQYRREGESLVEYGVAEGEGVHEGERYRCHELVTRSSCKTKAATDIQVANSTN